MYRDAHERLIATIVHVTGAPAPDLAMRHPDVVCDGRANSVHLHHPAVGGELCYTRCFGRLPAVTRLPSLEITIGYALAAPEVVFDPFRGLATLVGALPYQTRPAPSHRLPAKEGRR
jgi:hypothetical protein